MAKIGSTHLGAFARQGLSELRNAVYPGSSITTVETGLYGTTTQGEVASDRREKTAKAEAKKADKKQKKEEKSKGSEEKEAAAETKSPELENTSTLDDRMPSPAEVKEMENEKEIDRD